MSQECMNYNYNYNYNYNNQYSYEFWSILMKKFLSIVINIFMSHD